MGGMGVYSMSHLDYPINCYVDRHARCILLIVKFSSCLYCSDSPALFVLRLYDLNFEWIFENSSRKGWWVSRGRGRGRGRGRSGDFRSIPLGLPPKQTSFSPRIRNDMRSVFASTRQLLTVITRNQIMDLINYLSAEEWQIAEGGNLEGKEMVVTLNQMDQTHTVQHWVLP